MLKEIRTALVLFLLLAVLTGLVYPLVMTGIGQLAFPYQANGSLIRENGKIVGSALIGQYFREPQYFWSRPSATSPMPYNGAGSSASNLGPNNPVLLQHVKARVEALKRADPAEKGPVPVDLVTSSASGLDPDISIAAANYQILRIAHSGGISPARLKALVQRYTTYPLLGFIGEPVVNAVRLNLALHAIYQHMSRGREGK
ncbi:potassium-transporting ATPase subunit KdpC [Acidithiobacillus caldus]|uniref:Potassium-transporting ATPase KdpC subunit n=3 Tax=Acidithiobacillus caldus TaxID=33059 RepID=F9ZPP0_ACICS|nr:potassium-transporting ATPase subunit KdpC [Acidithiobacillus caldus]AEK56790.1 Potassium-transporting ATPase C chain [Acidithiobacillus caldus SM-1]AIA54097.1 Potassium-transporting ATPase C chain [Acidithiobacillus caldus ATCC 51756]AIA56681.1 Potassium-transporting ATPase C chain [Acidithiobacillus caldus ATCC 51756]MBU2730681.1 potassium-transporting ATPase subunit KdpC [Acidithiobacillus caldus]MBU2734725.1 potassium-transporting ATPase subunit KdpC [Acidithiobacillus caldus ATCC 51756